SAHEACLFKQALGPDFRLLTPVIRPQVSDVGDQRRFMTPQQAQQAGVDYIVIGRPITQSADPAAALRTNLSSLNGV
ncbi:orotidine 5'-phosphate decarboxylase / HUMPS family protein, partial [Erwinia amylovora]|uniref:orotidine 5'-phosphate decarboxylase / HUMPS family protein n=1 Tax=Erwinia amylovora TaxID=552 RepID=UPI00200BA03E